MCVTVTAAWGEIHIALSGGNTPKAIFKALTAAYPDAPFWQRTHLWWGDERLVPYVDPASNYGVAKTLLLDQIPIPGKNIHPIPILDDPVAGAAEYAEQLRHLVPTGNGQNWPAVDWNILGLGIDGHTASLFPGAAVLNETKKLCVVAIHPDSGQRRISFTLPLINHSRRISFIISGLSKATIVKRLLTGGLPDQRLPAALVKPVSGRLDWYLDRPAAEKIKEFQLQ